MQIDRVGFGGDRADKTAWKANRESAGVGPAGFEPDTQFVSSDDLRSLLDRILTNDLCGHRNGQTAHAALRGPIEKQTYRIRHQRSVSTESPLLFQREKRLREEYYR